LAKLAALGGTITEVDFAPFYETAGFLYNGPWIAERYVVAARVLEKSPEAILPVTRQIIEAGRDLRTVDAFEAFYRLEELRRIRDRTFRALDALVVPTAPSTYSIADVNAEPVELNNRLGTYTNFVNLLDLCGLAVPASIGTNGLPFGITLLAPGGEDGRLVALARQFEKTTGLPRGAIK
jgi:allophanate hydrolase